MTFWVCAAVGYFADDVTTTCAHCQKPIVHRPTAPADSVKICTRCAETVILEDPAARVKVSPEILREAELFFAKTKGTQ